MTHEGSHTVETEKDRKITFSESKLYSQLHKDRPSREMERNGQMKNTRVRCKIVWSVTKSIEYDEKLDRMRVKGEGGGLGTLLKSSTAFVYVFR
jgi:hypothetical protein